MWVICLCKIFVLYCLFSERASIFVRPSFLSGFRFLFVWKLFIFKRNVAVFRRDCYELNKVSGHKNLRCRMMIFLFKSFVDFWTNWLVFIFHVDWRLESLFLSPFLSEIVARKNFFSFFFWIGLLVRNSDLMKGLIVTQLVAWAYSLFQWSGGACWWSRITVFETLLPIRLPKWDRTGLFSYTN